MLRRTHPVPLAALTLAAALAACGGGAPAPAPTCADGLRNAEETAVDCGGPACTPCPAGQACAAARDCLSAVCAPGGACAAPTCADLVRNGAETGVDCGGPACAACEDGLACAVDGDCRSGRCAAEVCLRALGAGCGAGAECASGRCVDGVCCETACGGACEACNLPGRFGRCDPVPDGEDPADECAAGPPEGCGLDGACSGGRACRLHAAGTPCAAAACTPDLAAAVPAAFCDGGGSCQPPAPASVSCAPLTCDPAGGACRTACADATQCAAGYGCAAGGGCLLLDGQACGAGAECLGGRCVDGVCCEAACDGACEACDLPGREGRCDPIPAGQDPASECAATSAATCGTSGACSGSRSCALWPGATVCAAASCDAATTSRPASLCSGAGACQSQGTVDCTPLACDGLTGLCRTSCGSEADCAPGYACAGGACRKVLGAACLVGAECGSGHCVDGTCCASACAGACEACDLPGRAGSCEAVPAGLDPANECADQGAATCGTTGSCSGARSCARYPAATTCAPAACVAGASVAPSLCDGAGTCRAGASTACGAYACSAVTGLCRTNCGSTADCAAGHTCAGGACLRSNGLACASGTECASGLCFDGVCCSAACGGLCQACDQPGLVGTCAPSPAGADPAGECPQDACHPGVCDGGGGCAVSPEGTPCGAGLACDASGACLDVNECTSGTAACDPNATCTNTAGSFTCACGFGWLGDGRSCRRPESCSELHSASPAAPSGLYAIDPDGAGGLAEFQASCDMTTSGGGWTVFQRRQDATVFDRTFAEYQAGFGSPAGSHWLGLDRLAALTATARELRVEVTSPNKGAAAVTYSSFSVGAGPAYVLSVGGTVSGTAGDSLIVEHHGKAFSARDVDNDTFAGGACALLFPGGWWFGACHTSHLNGIYAPGPVPGGETIVWASWDGLRNGLSFSEMKLR